MHLDFSADIFWTILKWLMIAIIWMILAWGIYREDRQMKAYASKELGKDDIASFLRMLHQRNVQMWVIITLLTLVGAAGDIRRDMATTQANALNSSAKSVAQETSGDALTKDNTARPASSALPFSDITEFNEKDSKQQAYIDGLKQRYEAWIVTYYYLRKCARADTQDLDLIRRAMQKELDAVHGGPDVQNNVLLAANGSYAEMYSEIPCDPEHLNASKASYDANMQQLRNYAQPESPGKIDAGSALPVSPSR